MSIIREIEQFGIPLSMDTLTTPKQVHALMAVSAEQRKKVMMNLEWRYGLELLIASESYLVHRDAGIFTNYIYAYREELKVFLAMGIMSDDEVRRAIAPLPRRRGYSLYWGNRDDNLRDSKDFRRGGGSQNWPKNKEAVRTLQRRNSLRRAQLNGEYFWETRDVLRKLGVDLYQPSYGDEFNLASNTYATAICRDEEIFREWRRDREGEKVYRHVRIEKKKDNIQVFYNFGKGSAFMEGHVMDTLDELTAYEERGEISILEAYRWAQKMKGVLSGMIDPNDITPSLEAKRKEIEFFKEFIDEIPDGVAAGLDELKKGLLIRLTALESLKDINVIDLDFAGIEEDIEAKYKIKLQRLDEENRKFEAYIQRMKDEIDTMSLFVNWANEVQLAGAPLGNVVERLKSFCQELEDMREGCNLFVAENKVERALGRVSVSVWVREVLLEGNERALIQNFTGGPYKLYLSEPHIGISIKKVLGLPLGLLFPQSWETQNIEPEFYACPARWQTQKKGLKFVAQVNSLKELLAYVRARQRLLDGVSSGGGLALADLQGEAGRIGLAPGMGLAEVEEE